MGRGKSRKQVKPPRTARLATPARDSGSPPTTGDNSPRPRDPTPMSHAGDPRERKLKRSRPLLAASCVLLIVWFAVLAALAWHSISRPAF